MSLNVDRRRDTPVDVGGRSRRTNAPREKRGGISLPVHLWQAIDAIVALQTEAYVQMGGETKASTSDELELAVEAHVKEFVKEHGPLPMSAKDRAEYVRRLAEANLKSLNDDLAAH